MTDADGPARTRGPGSGVAAFLLMLGACAAPRAFPARPSLPAAGRELVMLDGRSGARVGCDDLVRRAAEVDVVLLGETHHHPEGLAAAAFLFEALVAEEAEAPALALEFFDREDQVALDDLLTGVIDEAGLVERLDLTPRRYPPGHRAMVLAAIDAGRPVWAANAPRRYVRLARTDGLQALRELTGRQRALFAVPETTTPGAYRERFVEAMAGHGGDELDVDAMYRAQNVWDATMAETVHRAWREGANPVVLVVGRFHVEFEGGLARRLLALAPPPSTLTIAVVAADAHELAPEDVGRADVVVYAGGRARP